MSWWAITQLAQSSLAQEKQLATAAESTDLQAVHVVEVLKSPVPEGISSFPLMYKGRSASC